MLVCAGALVQAQNWQLRGGEFFNIFFYHINRQKVSSFSCIVGMLVCAGALDQAQNDSWEKGIFLKSH